MWSNLIDNRGLIRANIFYKAAFYDRDAKIHCIKRFCISDVYEDTEDRLHGDWAQVRDNALARTVFIDTPVRSGEHNGKLVAVKDNNVYVFEKENFFSKDKILQKKDNLLTSEVKLLTRKEFYGKWHSGNKREYEFIKAIEQLSCIECQKFKDKLPIDDSIWEPQFDFPAVV
jgi:hypothetical protein